ncbi:lysylphosphatidylglycerol synthase transmembrane domain-containing protein [Stutzerimonas nitrititolerans]|uniref:lysylphosphatidylglycerol synthase transmembrane domain-containing protein n=1 Tax=Stutzerimonas nitrititolerans TaxID=2482751 RepID=UPI0028A6CAFE|nr:lysylphosphatidylglycerol synthase transmembrane domain-containing protein [Stutzerimonas nitrititolerans]
MSRHWWILAAALTGAVLIPLLLGGSGLFSRLRSFPLDLLALMLGMIVLGWYLNAQRLRLLVGRRTLAQRRAIGIVMATEFAICATPGGAGGPLTLMALLMRHGVPPSKGTATYAVEQLSDLLFFICALVGVLIFALTHAMNAYIASLLGITTALLIGVVVLLALLGRFHRQVFLLNGWLVGRLGVKQRRKRRWARKMIRFRNALLDCFRLPRRVLLGVFALTTLHWLLRYSVLYLTLRGLGSELAWAWTFIVQLLALTAGQFSLLPGGAGSADLASAALLTPLVGKSTTAAAILIWRFVTYYFYLIVGAPVFVHLAGRTLFRLLRTRQN